MHTQGPRENMDLTRAPCDWSQWSWNTFMWSIFKSLLSSVDFPSPAEMLSRGLKGFID